MNKAEEKAAKEVIYNAAVFAVLVVIWVPVMNYFKGDVSATVATVFVVFAIVNRLARKQILERK